MQYSEQAKRRNYEQSGIRGISLDIQSIVGIDIIFV